MTWRRNRKSITTCAAVLLVGGLLSDLSDSRAALVPADSEHRWASQQCHPPIDFRSHVGTDSKHSPAGQQWHLAVELPSPSPFDLRSLFGAETVFQKRVMAADNLFAQNVIRGPLFPRDVDDDESDSEQGPGGWPPVEDNSEMLRVLEQAEAEFGNEKYRSGLEILQQGIFDAGLQPGEARGPLLASSDSFSDQTGNRSLRQQAQQLIANLPAEGKRVYEADYGKRAAVLLADAEESNDISVLEEIVRRFPQSIAGKKARNQLGNYHLDRGDALAAMRYLGGLRDDNLAAGVEPGDREQTVLLVKLALACWKSGQQVRFDSVMADLKALTGTNALRDAFLKKMAADGNPAQPGLAELKNWTRADYNLPALRANDWPMPGGNSARDATGAKVVPLGKPIWIDNPLLNPFSLLQGEEYRLSIHELLGNLFLKNRQEKVIAIPACEPIAVGGKVIFRALDCLRAVDARTGTLIWETSVMDHLAHEAFLQKTPTTTVYPASREQRQELYFSKRAWQDRAVGRLSSNGRFVFAVEDNGFVPSHLIRAGQERMQSHNRLCAFDIESGKLIWEVGGALQAVPPLECAGSIFLGPPVPHQSLLYVLAERQGEIRLWVLEEQTGQVRWTQSLVVLNQAMSHSYSRRLAGLSPALAGDVIVCPTGAGATVGIDRVGRQLLWIHRHTSIREQKIREYMRFRGLDLRGNHSPSGEYSNDVNGWMNGSPVLAQGRAFVLPHDSSDLICLDVATGEVLWTTDREQGIYLAGLHQEQVIVVGVEDVYALGLNDGQPIWPRRLRLGAPAGRGVVVEGRLHLPLATNEDGGSNQIATIDLENGRLLVRSPLPIGIRVGNLISAGDQLISQNVESIFSLTGRQTWLAKIENALAKQPAAETKSRLLALRGELLLHDGDFKSALTDLQQVSESGDPRTRELVATTLLEGLRFDFDNYRQLAAGLDRMLPEAGPMRVEYRTLLAERYEVEQNHAAALNEYLKLARVLMQQPEFDTKRQWKVGKDRWLRRKLVDNFTQLSATDRVVAEKSIGNELQQLFAESSDQDTSLAMSIYGGLNFVDSIRLAEIRQRPINELGVFDLQLLYRVSQQGDKTESAEASALLVNRALETGQYDAIPTLLEELNTRLADVRSLQQMTGAEFAASVFSDERLKPILAQQRAWPARHLTLQVSDVDPKQRNRELLRALKTVQPLSPLPNAYRSWTFRQAEGADGNRYLQALDARGEQRWAIGISESTPDRRFNSEPRLLIHGPFMFWVQDEWIHCFSLIDPTGQPKFLWRHTLFSDADDALQSTRRDIGRNMMGVRGRYSFGSIPPVLNRGPIVASTDSYLACQRGSFVDVIDPATGRLCWSREIVTGSDVVFGDDDYLFVVSLLNPAVNVYDAVDGTFVKTQPLFEGGIKRVGTPGAWQPGRMVPLTQQGAELVGLVSLADQTVLACVDLLTGGMKWERSWHDNTQIDVSFLDDGHLGVLEIPTKSQRGGQRDLQDGDDDDDAGIDDDVPDEADNPEKKDDQKKTEDESSQRQVPQGNAPPTSAVRIISTIDGTILYEDERVIDLSLPSVTLIEKIHVLENAYLIVSRRRMIDGPVQRGGRPPRSTEGNDFKVEVECIDRQTFTKTWSREFRGADLNDIQSLVRPMLLLELRRWASDADEREEKAPGRGSPVAQRNEYRKIYQLIDMRNGRPLWMADDLRLPGIESWTWDPESGVVNLMTARNFENRRQQLHVTLSDVPLSEPFVEPPLEAPLPE